MWQVNGVNVEREDYSRVAEMIRSGGNTLDLLVVDDASWRYFDKQHIAMTKDQPFVDVIIGPDDTVASANGLCVQCDGLLYKVKTCYSAGRRQHVESATAQV